MMTRRITTNSFISLVIALNLPFHLKPIQEMRPRYTHNLLHYKNYYISHCSMDANP